MKTRVIQSVSRVRVASAVTLMKNIVVYISSRDMGPENQLPVYSDMVENSNAERRTLSNGPPVFTRPASIVKVFFKPA